MSALWRDHCSTPRQQRLAFLCKRRGRATQAEVLLAMLREARAKGTAVELPEIMTAGIAQHGARFNEIRSLGFVVVHETDRGSEVVRSRYFLTFYPERDGKQ